MEQEVAVTVLSSGVPSGVVAELPDAGPQARGAGGAIGRGGPSGSISDRRAHV